MISEFVKSLILAIIQGATEWLPISSSGHLVLFEKILGFKGGGIEFDVALHFGTLMAVFVYFGKDIVDIIENLLKGKWKSEKGKLGLMVLVATIPSAVIGLLFRKIFESAFSSLAIVAVGFAITAIVLFIGSLEFKNNKNRKFGYGKALLIGCSQVIALFPGISRSGTTISAGLLTGLREKDAIKFSFLMSIPAILGANLIELGRGNIPPEMFIPTLISFIIGLITIHLLMGYVLTKKKNLRWFGVYALSLSIVMEILLFLKII
mgnify:CR=1 FL=1